MKHKQNDLKHWDELHPINLILTKGGGGVGPKHTNEIISAFKKGGLS